MLLATRQRGLHGRSVRFTEAHKCLVYSRIVERDGLSFTPLSEGLCEGKQVWEASTLNARYILTSESFPRLCTLDAT